MNPKRRGLKLVGALLSVFALSAVMAASAFAAHSGQVWTINGVELGNGKSETVSCSAAENFVFNSEVGTTPLEITATGVECLESNINQVIVGEAATAKDQGKLKFTGLTVNKPAGCGVEPITTNAITTQLVPVAGLTSGLSDSFTPTEGEVFAKIKITGCAIAETYSVKGSICAETEKLGTELVTQPLTFSSAINTSCGKELKLGTKKATLKGKGNNKLSGANAGVKFGAKTY